MDIYIYIRCYVGNGSVTKRSTARAINFLKTSHLCYSRYLYIAVLTFQVIFAV